TVVFTAIERPKADIDGDSNNDGTIAEDDDPIEENDPGYFIPLNRDDDNISGIEDRHENPLVDNLSQPVDEDDLRPVKFRVINPEQLKNGDKITLAVDSNAVRLWRSRDKQPLQL